MPPPGQVMDCRQCNYYLCRTSLPRATSRHFSKFSKQVLSDVPQGALVFSFVQLWSFGAWTKRGGQDQHLTFYRSICCKPTPEGLSRVRTCVCVCAHLNKFGHCSVFCSLSRLLFLNQGTCHVGSLLVQSMQSSPRSTAIS